MMMFMALIYSLFGRFIYSSGFTKKYSDYENFEDEIWQKAYVKFPVYVGLTLGLCFMYLIRDMDKLKFSAYIGVFSVIYSLFVVLVNVMIIIRIQKHDIILNLMKILMQIGSI